METTLHEQLLREVNAYQAEKKHNVRSVVPPGWFPYDLLQKIYARYPELAPPLKLIKPEPSK